MISKLLKITLALIIIGLGLTTLIVIQDMRKSGEPVSIERIQRRQGTPVTAVKSRQQDFTQYITTDGNITADDRAVLRSRISEVVDKVAVDVGEKVEKGQVLVKFRKDDLQAMVKARRAAVEEASNNYNRYKTLHEKGHVTRQQIEKRKTALENAQSALKNAKTNLEYASVTSPINGIIDNRYVDTGEFKAAGKLLVSIVKLTDITVRARVPEHFINQIEIGDSVEFRPRTNGDWKQAAVTRIRPSTDNPNRFFDVYMDLPNTRMKENWRLQPGMYCEVRFAAQTFDSATAVPKNCIEKRAGEHYIFGIEEATEQVPIIEYSKKKQPRKGLIKTVSGALQRYFQSWTGEERKDPADKQAPETKTVNIHKAVRINVTPGLQENDYRQLIKTGKSLPTLLIANPTEDLREGDKVKIQNQQEQKK